jgi:hypothetical protein
VVCLRVGPRISVYVADSRPWGLDRAFFVDVSAVFVDVPFPDHAPIISVGIWVELFAEGDSVDAVVLDAAGSASIMGAFSNTLTRIWQETTRRGWVTGTCLRPTQSYWDITGQQSFFR